LVTFGVEGVAQFGEARKSNATSEDDLDSTFTICTYFWVKLFNRKHKYSFYLRNDDCWEIHIRDSSFDGGGIDHEMVDNVDLFLISTHGTNDRGEPSLLYNTYKNSFHALAAYWRLGNTKNGLKWLMMYCCDVIDLNKINATYNIFQGLHEICGSYGRFYDSFSCDEVGEDVAQKLIDGETVAEAWLDGTNDFWMPQEPIVVAAEKRAHYFGGRLYWPLSTLNNDHLPPHGHAVPDILPSDKYGLTYYWIDPIR
jgi:hypothetical protein